VANPQPDQFTFTKISNEILEILPRCKFNGTQRGILDIVFRYTYGFNRKSHEISISFFCEAMGMTKSQEKQVRRELNELIELNVVTETDKPTTRTSRKLAFNKDWESWKIEIRSGGLIRPPREDKLDHSERTKKTTQTGLIRPPREDKLDHPREDYLDHQERNKENIKENIKESSKESVLTPETFFIQNIGDGKIKPYVRESIKNWIQDGIEESLILKILKDTVSKTNKPSWAYAETIVKDCFNKNILTVADFESEKLQYKDGVKNGNNSTNSSNNKKQDIDGWGGARICTAADDVETDY